MKFLGGFRARKLGDDAARARELARVRLRMALAACGGALLVLVVGGVWHINVSAESEARVALLEQENRRLVEELGVGRLALEMEKATSSGLERQLAEINDTLMKRQAELQFLKSQAAPTRR
ncbi:MAG: hypothetical protein Q7J47_19610 [Azoarcus sp.]|nr:hypothetical protein [Azoarcus sp.]PKO58392.1 MAG: hypothetical protein CVU25_04775 [Betaproteobacteria bacterium HGW-Betaproteobacteria-19]